MPLVCWDIDHTMLEPHDLHFLAYEKAFQQVFQDTAGVGPQLHGQTDALSTRQFLKANGVPINEDTVNAFFTALTNFYTKLDHDIMVRPGIVAALRGIQGDPRIRQTVLTGNLRAIAERKLELADARYPEFARVRRDLNLDIGGYGEDGEERAELVAKVLERVNAGAPERQQLQAGDVVLIGDTPKDVQAARGAGAHVVGIPGGIFTDNDLIAAGADVVVPDDAPGESIVRAVWDAAEMLTPDSSASARLLRLGFRQVGDPVLAQSAVAFGSFDDISQWNHAREILKQLEDTGLHLQRSSGDTKPLAIAAPERGWSARAVVLLGGDRVTRMINPEPRRRIGEQEVTESCLACPTVSGLVTRPMNLEVKYQQLDGKQVTELFYGPKAAQVAHALDHLDGKLFYKQLAPNSSLRPI